MVNFWFRVLQMELGKRNLYFVAESAPFRVCTDDSYAPIVRHDFRQKILTGIVKVQKCASSVSVIASHLPCRMSRIPKQIILDSKSVLEISNFRLPRDCLRIRLGLARYDHKCSLSLTDISRLRIFFREKSPRSLIFLDAENISLFYLL